MLARLRAGLARAVLVGIARSNDVATCPAPGPRRPDLRRRNGNAAHRSGAWDGDGLVALAPDELAAGDVLAQVLANLPRTMSRKRRWSGSMRRAMRRLVLGVAACEDRGHEIQHIGGADLAVGVVADEPILHHVDLLLRLAINHADTRLVNLMESFWSSNSFNSSAFCSVRWCESRSAALHRQGADVVHDLAAELLLARVGDVDLFLDGAHERSSAPRLARCSGS